MTNWKLVYDVTIEVSKLYEAEHIMETNDTIFKRVLNWYNHTDIAEFEMLVAAAFIGDYAKHISYAEIVACKEMLYPGFPLEYVNFHISEIEEALNDELEFWS